MPIDSARYPDLPPGAKLQPTADPETAYVLADDAATGKRTSIGIIRHGVFTPAPQYALVAAQAEFSKAAEEPAAPVPAAPAPHFELPDVFGKADDVNLSGKTSPVPASVYLTSVFFSVLTGGTTPADAARFYERHTGFVAALAGIAATTLPASLTEEAFRRFLAVLRPPETSQYLQKSLFTALSRYLKSAALPTSDVTFDAARATLSIPISTDGSLPTGFAYVNAVVSADGTPAAKPFFKTALEAGCDWVVRLDPEDAASSALTASVEKALSDTAGARLLHAWQVAMSQNGGNGRELLLELHDQRSHRLLLLRGAGVSRSSLLIQSAFIADTDAVGIISLGMCSHTLQRTGFLDAPIASDITMVADEAPVVDLHMIVEELLHCIVAVAAGSTAMYYD